MRPWLCILTTLAAAGAAAGPAAAGQPRPPSVVAEEIDREIDARLDAAKVPPSPPAGDAEFCRRVHLDLTGRLPTPERVVAFLDSKDPDKRARLIDELLDTPEFGQRFADYWTTLFVKRNDANARINSAPFRKWLAGRFNEGAGWDRMVTEMITAGGDIAPASLFLLTNRENDLSPSRTAATVGVLFLGVQVQCAECHRHPFTRDWRREDFWGLAAFFSRTHLVAKSKDANGLPVIHDVDESPRVFVPRPDPRKPPPPPGEHLPPGVLEIPDATDTMKRVGRARARYLEGDEADLGETGSYRVPFAAWLTSGDNRYFARAYANRMWSYFFARGLVNPVDDMNPANEPSHPAALEALRRELVASGFDTKHLVRCICNTRAYQRTSAVAAGNENDSTLFSHAAVKAVNGPVLFGLLEQVLGKPKGAVEKAVRGDGDRKKGGSAARSTLDLLDTAGYDESPDEYTAGVPQALRLMNVVLPHWTAPLAEQLARSGGEPERVVERLYLLTLSRRPTPEERKEVAAFLAARKDPAAGYAGLLWVLLSSPEFVTNH